MRFGKTFLAQLKLLMMARAQPMVSILERGDSYEPLVELMGGRVGVVALQMASSSSPTVLRLDFPSLNATGDPNQSKQAQITAFVVR